MTSNLKSNNRSYVKKKYTNKDVYPNEELHLLGESMFTPGKATLGLSEVDILGNRKQINYNITVR